MAETDETDSVPYMRDSAKPCQDLSNKQCGEDIENVKSPLTGLGFHDLRHHAITELAESQASDSTIMAIAGHVSPKTLQHYSHVRLQAKRTALDALCNSRPVSDSAGKREGYDTNRNTKLYGYEGRFCKSLETWWS